MRAITLSLGLVCLLVAGAEAKESPIWGEAQGDHGFRDICPPGAYGSAEGTGTCAGVRAVAGAATAEPAEPVAGGGGPAQTASAFTGDWDIVTERGDRVRLTIDETGGGLTGFIQFKTSRLEINGPAVTGDQADITWRLSGTTQTGRQIVTGTGRLNLLGGGKKLSGKLVLADGSAVQGGTWSGTHVGGAALPMGEGTTGQAAEATEEPATEPAETVEAGGGSRLACDQRGSLKSGDNGPKVTLTFHNGSSDVRKLNWINFDGKDVQYAVIDPGDTYKQQTFASHIWALTDDQGNCALIFKAGSASQSVEVP